MTHSYSTLRLETWKDFKLFIHNFSENWVFRGQADANWILSNAIERTAFIKFHRQVEADFVAEFQRGARNYLSRDAIPEHLIEWLALMQHHGAPTRLLDLSRSPFIAAYFAYEICHPAADNFVSVWGVNVHYLKTKAVEILQQEYGADIKDGLIKEAVFERIFYDNNRKLVFPVEPFRMNRRYSLQQSVFLSTGISHIPLMDQLDFLGDAITGAVVKMELPSIFKKEALRDLLQMNLHRASLFPDLDGYAASLKHRYNSMKTPEEIMEQHIQKLEDEGYRFFP